MIVIVFAPRRDKSKCLLLRIVKNKEGKGVSVEGVMMGHTLIQNEVQHVFTARTKE